MEYLLFLAIYGLALFFSLLAGALAFNSVDRSWGEARKDLGDFIARAIPQGKWILGYVLMIFLIPAVLAFYPYYHAVFSYDFTPGFFSRESSILFGIQAALQSEALTIFLSIVYVFGVVYVLFLTPILVAWRTGLERGMEKLFYLISLNVTIALPFFVLMHVTVPCVYRPDIVKPLMYDNPSLHDFVAIFGGEGGFHNDFPSHHVSTTFALFFFACINRRHRLRRYALFTGAVAVLTLMATIYLGIHYLLDVAGGLALAALANIAVLWMFRNGGKASASGPPVEASAGGAAEAKID